MLNQAESKQFNRLDMPCVISYKFPDSDQSYDGECLNLSGNGIVFMGKHILETGMAQELTIATKNELTKPLRAYVEVIRCEEVWPEHYEVATEIKGIREY